MAVTFNATAGSAGIPFVGAGKTYVAKSKVIDMQTLGCVTTDIVQCLNIPAGTLVHNVVVKIVRAAAGTTATADVGDDAGTDSFDNDINLKATAGTLTIGAGGTDAFVTAGGKLYTAANTIDLVLTHNTVTDAGSVQVFAICTAVVE